jgi:hypothetical protein
VLLAGDNDKHRSVERGDALRILEQSDTVRYVELLYTQRQKAPALKAAIEDLKVGSRMGGRNLNGTESLRRSPMVTPQRGGARLAAIFQAQFSFPKVKRKFSMALPFFAQRYNSGADPDR